MTSFFFEALVIMIVFLYGSVGEIITEKTGHLNLGTPGIMCMGGAGAIVGVKIFVSITGFEAASNGQGNWFLGLFLPIIFGLLFALLTGLLYCFIVVTLRCNQNVTGLLITTFGDGFLKLIGTVVYPSAELDKIPFTKTASTYFQSFLPASFLDSNWFTIIFLKHGILFYLAIAIAIAAFFIIRNTRVGLWLRAVGENPGTAEASGINVTKYKYLGTLVGAAISGLGGVYYFLEKNGGSGEFGIAEYGWIAVALVIFAIWNTGLSIAGSFVFAIFYAFVKKSVVSGWPNEIFKLLPYFVTVAVLILVALFKKRETQPPSALGQSYYKEDR